MSLPNPNYWILAVPVKNLPVGLIITDLVARSLMDNGHVAPSDIYLCDGREIMQHHRELVHLLGCTRVPDYRGKVNVETIFPTKPLEEPVESVEPTYSNLFWPPKRIQ